MLKMRTIHAMAADDAHLGVGPSLETHTQVLELGLELPVAKVLDGVAEVVPRRAAEEDPQHAQLGQVGAQAAAGRRRAQVRGPQAQVAVAHAQADVRDAGRVRLRHDVHEHVGVGRVREHELVGGVQDRHGFVVYAFGHGEEGRVQAVVGVLAGPDEGLGGGEGVGVDAVAEFAREPEER